MARQNTNFIKSGRGKQKNEKGTKRRGNKKRGGMRKVRIQ